jgi:hypothetical protein
MVAARAGEELDTNMSLIADASHCLMEPPADGITQCKGQASRACSQPPPVKLR